MASVSVFSTTKYRYYFGFFWITWSAVHAWVLQDWGYRPEDAWIDSAISNGLLAGISLITILSLRYYFPRKESISYLVILCIGLALLWLGCAVLLLPYLADDGLVNSFKESIPFRLAIAILVLACVILISALNYILEEQKEQEKRKSESEKIARDAELYKLRQQLQPHFLFNSLNSISALVISQPDEAREMVQQLSDYLRSTLKKEENQWVALSEELHYIELYLGIERVRFGSRLSTHIQSDSTVNEMKIPAMLLQPIVENAIKFGLYDNTGDILISIDAHASDKTLTITVKNPFDPAMAQPNKGAGFGLSSVRRRLYLLFARNDLLSTFGAGQVFVTQLKIPQS